SSQQVLVMVDGRPVNDSSLGSANLTEIPSENIERIEIMRGPSSALYGANALGGVVNIITKKATAVKPKTEIGIEKGSFNTQNYKMNFTAMPGKANIFLSGGKNITDGFRDNSDYDATNLSAKIGYDFEKYGELTLSNGFLTSELGVPGPNYVFDPITWQKIILPEKEASSPNANQKDKKIYNQLEHKINIKNTSVQTKIYQDYQERHYKNPDSSSFKDTISRPQNFGFSSQVDINSIVLGLEERNESFKRTDDLVQTVKKSRNNTAVFFQKTFEMNKLFLTPGIRYDYNSLYKDSTNPRLSTVYKLTGEIKLSANVGTAFRAPTYEDLYSPFDPSMWTQGNPNVGPEKSIGTDIGIEYSIKDILLSRLTLFYNYINDFIQWAPTGPNGLWVPDNVAKAFSRGVELELKNDISKKLTQNLNYTFLESWGKETGTYKVLQYTPKHRLNYGLNYSAPLKLKTKLGVEYTHKQEWKAGTTDKKIPGYTLANLRVSRKILQSEVYFSCENLFNKRYFARENYPLPGRTFSGGINLYLWD
ncbi:MAG: hypothetical protein CVU80_02235, partial [Elusimicrobia bacterium HGW-Elusimicrobia-4]